MANPYNLEPIEDGVEKKMQEKFTPGNAGSLERPVSSENVAEKGELIVEGTLEDFLTKARENAQSSSNPATQVVVSADVNAVSQEDSENRVKKLIAIAKEKGVVHAFEIALKLDDLYVIDQLHDTLSGELYDELIRSGILKKNQ
jgi:hypothetical protein